MKRHNIGLLVFSIRGVLPGKATPGKGV